MIDELLVHISAPTTRQGDEQYRSLAEAYLEFEPHDSQRSSSRHIDVSNQPASSRLHEAASPNQGESFRGTADTSILSASKDSYGSFPSYLSSGGLKTLMPAVDRWNHDVEDNLPPTSSRTPETEDMRSNRKWQKTLRSISTEGTRLDERVYDCSDVDVGFIEDTQVAAAGVQSQSQGDYLMELDDASENDTNGGRILVETIEPPVAATPDTKHLQHRRSKRLEATPTTSKSSAVTTLRERAGPGNTPRSSMLSPKRKTNEQEDIGDSSQSVDFTKLESIVYPPEPNVSTAQPGTLPSQITPQLAALKKQHPTQFQPLKTLTKPKPDDRGYWLIRCSRWSPQSQQLFWNELSRWVSSGRLGWGVTLFREGGTSLALGKVKLYCWGEIVEHTWILLWTCSEGKICGSSYKLKWIDANGKQAFLMR